MRSSFLFAFHFCFCAFSEAARILLFHPSPGKSHAILSTTLMEALADRGHDVTVVNPFSFGISKPNYREIVTLVPDFDDDLKSRLLSGKSDFRFDYELFQKLQVSVRAAFNATFHHQAVQRLMREESFDFIVFGYFFNAYQIGLAAHFNCPYAVLSPTPAIRFVTDFTGEHSYPATVPNGFLGYYGSLTYWQRFVSFLMVAFEELVVPFSTNEDSKVYDSYFPPDRYLSFEKMRQNCSLLMVNHHFSQGQIRPYLPNTVEIGGIQIKEKPNALPSDIQSYLDKAKDGAVVWIFGGNVPISELPQGRIDAMLEVLAKLKQRVIMRWESDDLERVPTKILTKKWLPQEAILTHPNVKLFITHGGSGSVNEARYRGVPILGIPFFADQFSNLDQATKEGWCKMLDFNTMDQETFAETLREMLHVKSFKDRAAVLSEIYRDRLVSPLETAVYWVEYVIRHQGAGHLYYQGKDLNWFQSTSLDVITVLALIIYIFYKIAICTFKAAFKCLRGLFKAKIDEQKKKKD